MYLPSEVFLGLQNHLVSKQARAFETVKALRTALSKRSASVLPGTGGAGSGFIIQI
jgi:hypothetical protein